MLYKCSITQWRLQPSHGLVKLTPWRHMLVGKKAFASKTQFRTVSSRHQSSRDSYFSFVVIQASPCNHSLDVPLLMRIRTPAARLFCRLFQRLSGSLLIARDDSANEERKNTHHLVCRLCICTYMHQSMYMKLETHSWPLQLPSRTL